jgi:hypothetical protein
MSRSACAGLIQTTNRFPPERIGNILQITIPLPCGLHHTISGYGLNNFNFADRTAQADIHRKDLLWTNPTKSLWNTTFKIIFIAAQVYIVYLMLNDYKPTHDTSQDTFKVEYLVGGAAAMGILLPYSYRPAEVGRGRYPYMNARFADMLSLDALGVLNLAGVRRHSPSVVHASTNRGGGDHNDPLLIRTRGLSRPLHSQLDLAILYRGSLPLGSHSRGCWHHSNGSIHRLLLHLLHKVRTSIIWGLSRST